MWIYEPDQMTARCKGCHAPIRWAVTEKLARIPLDLDWLSINQRNDENGVLQLQVDIRFSHFKTCPMRDRFSSKKTT